MGQECLQVTRNMHCTRHLVCSTLRAFETKKWLSAVIITVKPLWTPAVYDNKTSTCVLQTGYLVGTKETRIVIFGIPTTCPLDNSPETTHPRSSDLVVDKRMKNNLYDVKSLVHIFSNSFGSVVNKITRGLVVWRWGQVVWSELSWGLVVCQTFVIFSYSIEGLTVTDVILVVGQTG